MKISFLLFSLLLWCGNAYGAIYVKVPSTPVWLTPPDGFELTNKFSGFINKTTQGSILVISFPGKLNNKAMEIYQNAGQFKKAMLAENFIIQDEKLLKTTEGQDLTLYHGIQKADNAQFEKWVTMIISQDGAYIVTLQTPENAPIPDKVSDSVFKSIKISQTTSLKEQLDVLPFSFKSLAPFIPLNTLAGNSVLLSTFDSQHSDDRPSIVISESIEVLPVSSSDQAMRLYLASIANSFSLTHVNSNESVMFAGYKGVKLSGNARYGGKDVEMIIYASLTKTGKAIFFHVTAPKGTLKSYQATISEIAQSVNVLR